LASLMSRISGRGADGIVLASYLFTTKAERLLCNLARRLDQEAPGVAASILEVSTRC
jgi:hypothetical protein